MKTINNLEKLIKDYCYELGPTPFTDNPDLANFIHQIEWKIYQHKKGIEIVSLIKKFLSAVPSNYRKQEIIQSIEDKIYQNIYLWVTSHEMAI